MWLHFFWFGFLYLAIIYVPGLLISRAIRLRVDLALFAAPAISIAFYAMMFILFGMMGMACSLSSCLSAILIVCIVFLVIGRRLFGTSEFDGGIVLSPRCVLLLGAVYIIISFSLYFLLFYRRFQDPSFMIQGFDTLFHVNLIRSFFDSQNFSSLTASLYQSGLSPFSQSSGGFYPSAWHGLCALALEVSFEELNIAANALNYVFAAVIYPSGIFLLLLQLLKKQKGVSCYIAGAFLSICTFAFPWAMLLRGEQFPQFSSFALLPLVVALVIVAIDSKQWREKMGFVFISLLGCVSLALLQTSSVFALFIFVSAYITHCVYQHFNKKSRRFAFGVVCVALVGFGLVWLACYKMPFMRSLVEFEWPSTMGIMEGIASVFLFSFSGEAPLQPLLLIAFIIGAFSIVKNRKGIHLILPWLFFAMAYIASVSSDGTYIKHILGGFWYTDPARLSALTCIASIPVLCIGLDSVLQKIALLVHQKSLIIPTVISAAFCVAVIALPVSTMSTNASKSFNGVICHSVDELIGTDDAGIFSTSEKAFVARVLGEVDNNSVIVNCPDDGSAFAYADDDANVLYRRNYADTKGESLESKIIRHNLKNIAANESVQAIVERWNIRYVLQLTSPDGEGSFHTYKLDDWDGIQLINESTEGFNLVDQEGDMRLYEIAKSDF